MAHNNRPGFWVTTKESRREARLSSLRKRESIWVEAENYSKLKTQIRKYLPLSVEDKIHVYRKRRGQFGEWFEHWQLVNGRAKIVKQGWQ
jgi:hypothetical protein